MQAAVLAQIIVAAAALGFESEFLIHGDGGICVPNFKMEPADTLAPAMVDEMVVAQAQWLPQYADAVPAAKDRIAKSTVKTRDWDGAPRKRVRHS